MILQNKQTGMLGVLEATTYHGGRPDNIIEVYEMGMGAARVLAQYKTLEELLGEWEDYNPKEPYIGDKATAMFVRAWAKHWGIERVKARTSIRHGVDLVGWVDDSRGREIDIQAAFVSGEIEDGHEYTIEELCGEEKE